MFRQFHLRNIFLVTVTFEPERGPKWHPNARPVVAYWRSIAWRMPQNRPLRNQGCSIFVHSTSRLSECFHRRRIRCAPATRGSGKLDAGTTRERHNSRAQIAGVALRVNFDAMSFSETSPRRELRQAKLGGEASAPRRGQRGSASQKARVTVHNKTRTTASQNRADKAERTTDPTAGEVEPRIRRPSGSTSTLSVPTKPGSSTSPTGLSPARIRDFSSKRP